MSTMNNLDTVMFDDGSSVEVPSTMVCNISSLCPEMKCLILDYLDIDSLLTFSLVSKEWYHFISSDSVWHERFNRLEKTDEEPRLEDYNITDLPPVNLYTVNQSLTAEQLQEVEGYQFLSIHNVKLAFFFNKSSLICNRLLATRGGSRFKYRHVEYFVTADDGIVWHNYDDSAAKHTQFQHCSLLRNRTRPIKNGCFHYRHYDTRVMFFKSKAYPTERQQYSGFFTSEQFLLGVCEHMIHVYRYSAETDQFNKTHELNMAPDVLASNLIGIIHWGNRTSTVILVGESWIWKWDLINGEKMAQVNISNLMSPGEDLMETVLAKDSQLVITKGNSNVLLLDLSKAAVAWEVKMDIFHIKVSNEYIISGEYKNSEQICVYDVNTGSKLYEVPIPEHAIVRMEDLFLSRRGDILIVIPCYDFRDEVFYFDLKNRKQLKVTAQGEHSEVEDDDDEYDSDNSSVESHCSFDYDQASRPVVSFVDGPGETVIKIQCYVCDRDRYCNISVRLIDCRNNRSIRIGRHNRLFDLGIDQYKVGWDKDFRRWTLRVFRDYGECFNYTMTTWISTQLFELLIEKDHEAILSLIGRQNPTLPTKDITVLTSYSDTSGTTLVLCVGELYMRELKKLRFKVHFGLTQLTFKLIGKKDTTQTENSSSQPKA